MRVRAEAREYVHTNDKRKRVVSRAYALVDAAGKPLFVGLFASEDKAEAFCKERGWELAK